MRAAASFFWNDQRGAAAAEMALVTPLLVIMLFGALEVGKFFWDQHNLVKGVRDGVRFASRQSFASYDCDAGTVAGGVQTQVKNLVLLGTPDSTDPDAVSRFTYWVDPANVTVTVDCYDISGSGATAYSGIYQTRITLGENRIPRVIVNASVPYTPLVGSIGFPTFGLELNASAESAVMGV